MDFGVDYWEDLLIPLDNYISKGTATFISSTNPNYQESLYHMVEHTLTGAKSWAGGCIMLSADVDKWVPARSHPSKGASCMGGGAEPALAGEVS